MAMNDKTERFEALRKRVIKWADSKEILKKANPHTQFGKFLEEFRETWCAIWDSDLEQIIDGIGDTAVTIIIHYELAFKMNERMHKYPFDCRGVFMGVDYDDDIDALEHCMLFMCSASAGKGSGWYEDALQALNHLALNIGIDLNDCLEAVLNVIEKRTGRMINGVFVKDQHNELLKD